jgi:PilZ domain
MIAEISSVSTGQVQTGTVCAADRGMLRVETRWPYQQGERVLLRVGGCEAPGTVMYSIVRDQAFRTAIALRHTRENRRRERRVPFGHPARVTVLASTDGDTFDGVVSDMSSSGIGLRSRRELRPMETISVQMQSCIIFGEVVHCVPDKDGIFQAGVRVAELLGSDPRELSGGRWEWVRRLLQKFR